VKLFSPVDILLYENSVPVRLSGKFFLAVEDVDWSVRLDSLVLKPPLVSATSGFLLSALADGLYRRLVVEK